MQSAAVAPPVELRCVPSPHSVTTLAPARHQPPASHASHAVAPDDDWYSPAAHSKHAPRPETLAKPPGAQATGSVERARQELPAGHALHDDAPAAGWYVPPAQPAQLLAPSDAAVPASQATGAAAPATHAEPGGHASQSSSLVALPLALPGVHVPLGQGDATGEPFGQK
jgi:hypothetical protein